MDSNAITGDAIHTYRLMVMRSAVKLEAKGMKGRRNVTALARKELGLGPRVTRDVIVAELTKRIEESKCKLTTNQPSS